MKIDILDYLGKYEEGILVLISLGYDDNYYEATFYYKKNLLALTPDDELEKVLGCQIEDWLGYNELMIDIMNKVVPYEQIINMTDDFNPEKYGIFKKNNPQ